MRFSPSTWIGIDTTPPQATSLDVVTGKKTHTNTSYLTMVAKDEEGKPRPVPKLVLDTKKASLIVVKPLFIRV